MGVKEHFESIYHAESCQLGGFKTLASKRVTTQVIMADGSQDILSIPAVLHLLYFAFHAGLQSNPYLRVGACAAPLTAAYPASLTGRRLTPLSDAILHHLFNIDINDLIDAFKIFLGIVSHPQDAGIIDQDIDTPELVLDFIDKVLNLLPFPNIYTVSHESSHKA